MGNRRSELSRRNREPEVNWWTPVWRGLVCDPHAKHYNRIKSALWLFLYLLLHANRKTGVVLRKVKSISRDMHIPLGTVREWMARLRDEGYIETNSSGHALAIRIRRWSREKRLHEKDIRDSSNQSIEISETRVLDSRQSAEKPTKLKSHNLAKKLARVPKIQQSPYSNITRVFKNNVPDGRGKTHEESINSFQKSFKKKNADEEDQIMVSQKKCWAYTLSGMLNDRQRRDHYFDLCSRFPLVSLERAHRILQMKPREDIPTNSLSYLTSLLENISSSDNSH